MPEPFKCFFQIANAKGPDVYIKGNRCYRCGHEWVSSGDTPRVCPKCKSPYWDRPRRKEIDPENDRFMEIVDKLSVSFDKLISNAEGNISEESALDEIKKLVQQLGPEEKQLLKKKLLDEKQ